MLKTRWLLFISLMINLSILDAVVYAREIPVVAVTASEVDFALRGALLNDNFSQFTELLATGADPTARLDDSYEGWVFCAATKPGKESYLESILHSGVDVDFRQSDIATAFSLPLNCAVMYGNLAAAKILVGAGANPALGDACSTCRGVEKSSVLREAVMVREYEIANWLLKNASYTQQQLESVKYSIEHSRVDESAPGNQARLELAEALRKLGLTVQPWSDRDNQK